MREIIIEYEWESLLACAGNLSISDCDLNILYITRTIESWDCWDRLFVCTCTEILNACVIIDKKLL